MGSELDCEILGGCQREPRGQDSLDRRIVGEVDEHGYVVEGALFLEVVPEETSLVGSNAHGCEDCCEWLVCASDLGLAGDLGRDLVVRESGGGEQGEFSSSDECVHSVDGGDACLDEFSRIFPGEGIDGAAVYVEIIVRDDSRATIGWPTAAVEDSTKHVL